MSQHNIIGSEAFNRAPFILVRHVRSGGMRRRRSRNLLAFTAGAIAMLLTGIIIAAFVFGPALSGG